MNDKNIIVNKPEPKPGILERGDLFAIAVGMVIGSGMVTLIGNGLYRLFCMACLSDSDCHGILYGFSVYYSWWDHARGRRPVFHRNEPFRSQHRRSGSLYETGNADPQQFFCVGTGIVFE